jgi:hypothetical protein
MTEAKPIIGEPFESSLWYNDEQPTERPNAEKGIRKFFKVSEKFHGVVFGPIKWSDLAPGDDRVPEPPAHFAGTPRILMGTAEVVILWDRPEPDQAKLYGGLPA